MNHENENIDPNIETYGDEGIASNNAIVPRWLKFSYLFWIFWGFVWWYYFWNGSYGWLDRGYWLQLQRAANTTYPFHVDTEVSPAPPEEVPPPKAQP